jgi:hypothetical protein
MASAPSAAAENRVAVEKNSTVPHAAVATMALPSAPATSVQIGERGPDRQVRRHRAALLAVRLLQDLE